MSERGREPIAVAIPSLRVRDLLYSKWRSIRNLPQSQQEGGPIRIIVLVVLGVLVWAGIYGASHWFFGKTLALEPFGEILVRKILSMAFIVIFAVLCFSNLISAFSTYLLADELQFLMARPLAPRTFFTSRFLENAIYSSWMPLLFGLPLFLAAGVKFSAGASYYFWLIGVLLPFMIIPPAIATIIVLLLANLMPVERTREVFVALGAIAFIGVFILARQLAPDDLFKPGNFGSTMEFFASLRTPGRYWLPSSWAIEVLYPALTDDPHRRLSWLHVGCLYATSAGLFFMAAWTFKMLYIRGYSRAQQGKHNEVQTRVEGAERQALAREKVRKWLKRMRRRGDHESRPLTAIAHKDLTVFVRDTVQWSQLLLLGGLVVIYLYNIKNIGSFSRGGIFGPIGIYFLNIGLSAFLVAAVSVRMVFPAVSLEGKAFWLVRRAPIGLRDYLVAKWLGHTPNLLILALILAVSSNWIIGTSIWLMTKSVLLIVLLVVSLTGLGVGMGAMFPRFHIDNAAKIATGIGGVLFMLIGVALTTVVIALDAWPTYQLMRVDYAYTDAYPDGFWWKAGLAWSGAVAVCLGSAWIAIVLGARRLGR